MRPSLLVLAICAALAMACSSDQRAPARSTSESPTPSPLPGGMAGLEVSRVTLNWIDAAPVFDLSTARESPIAAPEALPRLVRWSAADGTGAASVPLNGPLESLDWDGSNIAVSVPIHQEVYSPLLRSYVDLGWHAKVMIDPVDGSISRKIDDLPYGAGISSVGHPLYINGGSILLSLPMDPPAMQRPFGLYLQSPDGTARRLDLSVGASQPARLTLDGSYVVFTGTHSSTRYDERPDGSARLINLWETYFMPVDGREALKVNGVTAYAMRGPEDRLGAPPDSRVVMIVAGTADLRDGLLAVFDTTTGGLRTVAPVPLSNTVHLSWHDGEVVRVGDAEGLDIEINLRTGASTPVSARPTSMTVPSPNGTRAVRLTEPDLGVPLPPGLDCTGRPFRFEAVDAVTGGVTIIDECAAGFLSSATWVDDYRLVLQVSEARGGRGGPPSLVSRLYNLDSGETVQLTTVPERYSRVFASADGTQFALSGDRLRIFTAEGAMLADLGTLPANYWVSMLAWSPDGESIAYVLEPIQ